MTIEVKPVHGFEDMATMFAPKDPQSSVCWCLPEKNEPKD